MDKGLSIWIYGKTRCERNIVWPVPGVHVKRCRNYDHHHVSGYINIMTKSSGLHWLPHQPQYMNVFVNRFVGHSRDSLTASMHFQLQPSPTASKKRRKKSSRVTFIGKGKLSGLSLRLDSRFPRLFLRDRKHQSSVQLPPMSMGLSLQRHFIYKPELHVQKDLDIDIDLIGQLKQILTTWIRVQYSFSAQL